MLVEKFDITSPKRTGRPDHAWEGFFPYYAGFPESFASRILSSADLRAGAVVFDPWNGSGTTTYTASSLGFSTVGFDINPAMVVVGRARLLAPTEADSLIPLCKKVLASSRTKRRNISPTDPLLAWFGNETGRTIRAIEQSICEHLVGASTKSEASLHLENLSGLAAAFYVALFSLCRSVGARFRSSNPTWFRHPKSDERRIAVTQSSIEKLFLGQLTSMADALKKGSEHPGSSTIRLADSTQPTLDAETADLVLTSPPYCTRIDYAAATRIELAILSPLLGTSTDNLRRKILGSIQVPKSNIEPKKEWGQTCAEFLNALRDHPSKASAGYYHKTHLDYFDKLFRSISALSTSLKSDGAAILVVQDSYYKDLHNDLAGITSEMALSASLFLSRRDDFFSSRSMSGINGRSRAYMRPLGATESVLCFKKQK